MAAAGQQKSTFEHPFQLRPQRFGHAPAWDVPHRNQNRYALHRAGGEGRPAQRGGGSASDSTVLGVGADPVAQLPHPIKAIHGHKAYGAQHRRGIVVGKDEGAVLEGGFGEKGLGAGLGVAGRAPG